MYLHTLMGVTRIGNQARSEIFTVAATLGSSSFHNLFHKAGRPVPGRRRPEKVSYSFNNCGKSRNYSKVTKLLFLEFQMACGPRKILTGRKNSALRKAITPCTAIPTIRKGSRINHTNG